MDIVERVARAICVANGGGDPDKEIMGFSEAYTNWKDYRGEANAALESAGVRELVEALDGLLEVAHAKLPTTKAGELAMATARTALARYRGEA
jgi:hypothetical protein